MRICHAHKLIYLSIPKTASEAVRAYLDACADEPVVTFPETTPDQPFYSHMRPSEIRAVFDARGLDFDSYRCVVTVRNPFARLASLYRMAREAAHSFRTGRNGHLPSGSLASTPRAVTSRICRNSGTPTGSCPWFGFCPTRLASRWCMMCFERKIK